MSSGAQGLSLYTPGELTPECVMRNQLRLSAVFPRMGENFFNLLTERLVENGFSDERLTDAINHLIDNFQYKELNVSDVLRFDKVKKLYDYSAYCDEVSSGRARGGDFGNIKINGKFFWYKYSENYSG